jgi:HEAT repeats
VKRWMLLPCFLCLVGAVRLAQTQQEAPPPQSAPADTTADNGEEPDAPVPQSAKANKTSVESETNTAWEMLDAALSDSKTQAQHARIDAVTAIGTLSDFERAQKWLHNAARDPDRYLRLAAVAAMGASKKAIFVPDLKAALKDSAPEVSFAGAVSLWKMHDRSGENFLYGVLAGERKVKQGFVSSEMHQVDQDLHSPSTLAVIGIEQVAYALLGPFGFGISAFRMIRNGNNGSSARVLTATLMEEDRSKATMQQFLDALEDHDYFVRAAAARALGNYRGQQVTDALQEAFGDPKPAVRLMAAASYVRASHPLPTKRKARPQTGLASKSSPGNARTVALRGARPMGTSRFGTIALPSSSVVKRARVCSSPRRRRNSSPERAPFPEAQNRPQARP